MLGKTLRLVHYSAVFVLEVLVIFDQGFLYFHFPLGPMNYVIGPADSRGLPARSTPRNGTWGCSGASSSFFLTIHLCFPHPYLALLLVSVTYLVMNPTLILRGSESLVS